MFHLPAMDPAMQKMANWRLDVLLCNGELLDRLSEAQKQEADDLTNLPKDVY